MKNLLYILFPVFLLSSCCQKQSMDDVVNNALKFAEKQSLLLAEKYADNDTVLPRSFEHGENTTSASRWWTSGFFPGVLWYLYEDSHNEKVLDYAKLYTSRVEKEKFNTKNHDVGFMLYCSFGNGFRLQNDSAYKAVLLHGASSLSTRYNPNVGLIRSWDSKRDIWDYPVIIDNMMNLELLLWAGKNSTEKNYRAIAISHADKTMENHYRRDMSCFHVVSYDTITGLPHVKQTHQGYSDESAWARGQAWGLYGYTLMYRETRDIKYLHMAIKIARFMIHHKNMPEDMIPYWDYDAPGIPNEPRDASTAALMASALIELSGYVQDKRLEKEYLDVTEKQIRSLASPAYTAKLGENGNFILMHSTGNYPQNSEIDAPLTYADYYYIEALMRWKKKFMN